VIPAPVITELEPAPEPKPAPELPALCHKVSRVELADGQIEERSSTVVALPSQHLDGHVWGPPRILPRPVLFEVEWRKPEFSYVYELDRAYVSDRGVRFFLTEAPQRNFSRPGYWIGPVLFLDQGYVDVLQWGPGTRPLRPLPARVIIRLLALASGKPPVAVDRKLDQISRRITSFF
jgi:hypothetical protein